MQKVIWAEFLVLLGGTIFAWSNFTKELYNWYQDKVCTTGCAVGVNPFYTPCFYGAVFFLIAFVLSAIILKNVKINKPVVNKTV